MSMYFSFPYINVKPRNNPSHDGYEKKIINMLGDDVVVANPTCANFLILQNFYGIKGTRIKAFESNVYKFISNDDLYNMDRLLVGIMTYERNNEKQKTLCWEMDDNNYDKLGYISSLYYWTSAADQYDTMEQIWENAEDHCIITHHPNWIVFMNDNIHAKNSDDAVIKIKDILTLLDMGSNIYIHNKDGMSKVHSYDDQSKSIVISTELYVGSGLYRVCMTFDTWKLVREKIVGWVVNNIKVMY